MGVFLYFGAVMTTLAGVTVIWRGTFLGLMVRQPWKRFKQDSTC